MELAVLVSILALRLSFLRAAANAASFDFGGPPDCAEEPPKRRPGGYKDSITMGALRSSGTLSHGQSLKNSAAEKGTVCVVRQLIDERGFVVPDLSTTFLSY